MKRKRNLTITEAEFEKWVKTCEELLGALAQTTLDDHFMKHVLLSLMINQVVQLSKVTVEPTIH